MRIIDDIEQKIQESEAGALKNDGLYEAIVAHRAKFYHVPATVGHRPWMPKAWKAVFE